MLAQNHQTHQIAPKAKPFDQKRTNTLTGKVSTKGILLLGRSARKLFPLGIRPRVQAAQAMYSYLLERPQSGNDPFVPRAQEVRGQFPLKGQTLGSEHGPSFN